MIQVKVYVDRVSDDAPNWVLRGRERTCIRLFSVSEPKRFPAKTNWHDGEDSRVRRQRMVAERSGGKGRR